MRLTHHNGTLRPSISKIFVFLILSSSFCGLLLNTIISTSETTRITSPIPENTSNPTNSEPTKSSVLSQQNTLKDADALKKSIEALVETSWNNYSVYVAGLTSPFVLDMGGSIIYEAASVNKIPILAALYAQVDKGEIDLDDTITLQEKDIQDYGTGSIRYQKPGTVYSIKTLARLMMKQSDNSAAYIISNHIVGLQTIQDLITSWGLTQTDMFENKTSNKDIAKLMSLLWNGKIANVARTEELFAFMIDTDFENRIPALLPSEAKSYHKIGNEVGIIHDVGIVQSGTATYYIGILTSDIRNEEQAENLSSKISKTVYDFLTK